MITDDDVMSEKNFQTGEDMITDDDVMTEKHFQTGEDMITDDDDVMSATPLPDRRRHDHR